MDSWTHIINNLLNDFINGSLLPIALLNTILILHCSYWGTDTDLIVFRGLWAYFTKIVLEYTTPVSLHCIVTVAFSGASPVHSNITCHDYDKYRTSIGSYWYIKGNNDVIINVVLKKHCYTFSWPRN